MDEFDVVIIGGGAAGLNAGLVLARARRRVAIVDAGHPRNGPAAHLQGFLSRDGLPPRELLEIGRTEVRGYGGQIITGTAEKAEAGERFTVTLEDGRALRARRLLVTAGLTDRLPEVPGLAERWGREVHMCPYCHGWEVRDQPLAVLGGHERSIHQTLLLRQWSADLIFLPHTGPAPAGDDAARLAARGIKVVPGEVARLLVENDRLTGVEMADGTVLPRSGVFVAAEFDANDAVLTSLGCATGGNGFVEAGPNGLTSVPGVYAAGNVVDPSASLISAASSGSWAAMHINADLVEDDVALAMA